MPIISPPAKVLVTGANGFLAAWILHSLLEHGYFVRGTVRTESKSEYLRNLYKSEVKNQQLEFIVVPDMMAPGAFDDAVKGAHAIVHTASPVHLDADDPNELIEPAVKGTLGILESALKYAGEQLKRVVVTSSCAAVVNVPYSGIFDERSWNEGAIMEVQEKGKGASQLAKYRASKTHAERAAWDFVERNSESINWDLATICPPYIFGPVLLSPHSRPTELSASMSLFYKALFSKSMTTEELKEMKGMQGEWVDVRDVAEGHVRALEVSQAGGERFIFSSGPWIWQDWFDVANQLDIPDADFPIGTPGEGKQFSFKVRFDPKKARSTLGLEFRDMGQTTRDIVKDFESRGWVSLGAS